MPKIGKKTLECLLDEELVDAIDAIAKARRTKRATIVAEMIRAALDPLPRLEKAAFTTEKARELTDGYSVLTDFIERGFAAMAGSDEPHGGLEFDHFDGPDFTDEPPVSSIPETPVKPTW